jgi:hypothetical protein
MRLRSVTTTAIWFGLQTSLSLGAPQTTPTPATTDPHQAGATQDSTGATPDVEGLFAAAQRRYEAGDLPAALTYLEQCYEATASPNLLFNLAQLQRELLHCEAALDYYQRYLQASPDGERRSDAEQHVATLRQQCPPATAPVPPARQTPPPLANALDPLPAAPHNWSTLGWVTLGAGALATAASVYFAVETQHAKRDIERLIHTRDLDYGTSGIEGRLDDFYRDRTLAFVSGTAATLTIATGIYTLVVAAPSEKAKRTGLSITAQPNAVSVDCRLRF